MFSGLFHRLAHAFHLNCGKVETWWDDDKLMVGFRCSCGELRGVHISPRSEAVAVAYRALCEARSGDWVPVDGDDVFLLPTFGPSVAP